MATQHILSGINFIDFGETTMGQVGRYIRGFENICLKHLPEEREEINICK